MSSLVNYSVNAAKPLFVWPGKRSGIVSEVRDLFLNSVNTAVVLNQ